MSFAFFSKDYDLRHGYLSIDMISSTARSVVSIVDITDRKQAEEAVRKSEALHSKMVANIGDVIVIIDENDINCYNSCNSFSARLRSVMLLTTPNKLPCADTAGFQSKVQKLSALLFAPENLYIL